MPRLLLGGQGLHRLLLLGVLQLLGLSDILGLLRRVLLGQLRRRVLRLGHVLHPRSIRLHTSNRWLGTIKQRNNVTERQTKETKQNKQIQTKQK
jgi:hypothetical protein